MIYQEPFCCVVYLHKCDLQHTEPTNKAFRFYRKLQRSNNPQVISFLNKQLPVNLIQWKAVYADEQHCLPTTNVHNHYINTEMLSYQTSIGYRLIIKITLTSNRYA